MQTEHASLAGLSLSRIAFGCASVMGRIGRTPALRAMDTAFDHGITHFDVARSYGYGDAESVVGAFAAGKRDRITIATKFGIRASGAATGLRWIKPAVRQIARHIPYARTAIRAASGRTLTKGDYRLTEARASFEQSLRHLKTDYADILFIHDCSPADELSDELLGYLYDLVKIGRLRAWGIATQREWIAPLCAQLPVKPMIVQCAQDILHARGPTDWPTEAMPAIFHSPFGAAGAVAELRTLLARASVPPPLSDIASGFSANDFAARLLMEGALFMAGGNPVLCSMFNPSHIRQNVDAAQRPCFTPEHLSALIGLATRTLQ
jgi:diketogulonate reductase-like aldo/keto reductase